MNAAQTTIKCLRCHRPLRSAKSIADGRGRHCKAKAAAAAKASTAKPAQIDKAMELIDDGGLVLVRGTKNRRVFRSVSTDGTRSYLTAATGQCNCPAGLRNKPCYHRLAAEFATAA